MEEQRRWEKLLERLKTGLWGFGIVASILGARSLGAFHVLELMALDRQFATHPSFETPDKPITIVEIGPSYATGSEEKGYTIDASSLAQILDNIFKSDPAVVGTDIVSYRITGEFTDQLLPTISNHPNLITVEAILANPAEPLPGLSTTQIAQQVGFNDLVIDRDGTARRALLGAYKNVEEYKNSFAIQVVQSYFKSTNSDGKPIELDNGIQDPETMSFGEVEIPRIKPEYGYGSDEIFDIQTLINYPGQVEPFDVISAADLVNAQGQSDQLIKDRVVIVSLVGSPKEFKTPLTIFNSVFDNSQLVSGVEVQSHIISHLIKAIEHKQPLIWTNLAAQYLFLLSFSTLSIAASRFSKDVISGFARLSIITISSILLSYILLLQIGLWLPIAATLASVIANGLIYINYAQNERRWTGLIEQRNVALEKERHLSEKLSLERHRTIENVFDSIHNGPLQTLANLLRQTRDETIGLSDICLSLEDLNREIRYIGDSIKQDATEQKDSLDVSYAGTKFGLDIPLQELFQEVYDAMLSRPLLGFSKLKFTIIAFDPIDSEMLTIEVKRKLCRFLEEALGNVGKHASGATRLVVTGKIKNDHYELTVADNGPGLINHETETGEGTRIGREIEKLTRGKFIRRPNKPKGLLCQLTFPMST
ncbi:CHASE2 domain-containing protein [Leptothoe sp. PORK10 BA2]|uniref:CHASE2 domain-containing protein n=1 Tax=Leptothoe sp. PORK10 BA2 TaxID=3110254 RepID=UPI002B1FDAFC|nr:CHASE2 domain-containing protein [Leptothoe sp. PORK10 BA2]MEA5462324.1 CHASE2 domain-containing protein [Leptothoe sp. PORK10 BA2]